VQILELEEKYSELKSDLSGQISKRTKLLKIAKYFGFTLSNSNIQLIEPYIIDLIPDFLKYADELEVRGLEPKQIELLKAQTLQLKNLNLNEIENSEFEQVLTSIENKIQLMNNWLEPTQLLKQQPKIYFPLLEKNDDKLGSGYLESVSTIIKNGEQKFNISPADLENDEQLEKQLHLCFSKALEYCSHYIKKIKKSHTVYLYFENRLGILTGNSLGAALTLSFIEAILKHYNSPIVVNIIKNLAITGGINQDSKIISTSKAIIEAKVETVFYSDVEIMCVPKIDEIWAEEKLKQLKENYPVRDLKITVITDLEDLLNRRNVVEIKKQPLLKRTGKFVKKNWISAVATVLLAILFAYLFVMDFEDNPAMFEHNGNLLKIENKNGKVLWTIRLNFSPTVSKVNRSKYSQKIIDINNDGVNEVLIAEEDIPLESNNFGRVACFDKNKNLIWEYFFRDTVSTFRKWTNTYASSILDTITISNKKILFLMARNIPNFANAVFTIDLLTGKRYDSTNTLWNAGAINNCIFGDFNEDGITELVLGGMQNGYERAVLFSVDVDKMRGQTPAPKRYIFNGIPNCEVRDYILLPHSDYGKYFCRSNAVPSQYLNFTKHSKEIELTTLDGSDKPILFYFGFDKNLNFLWMDCGDSAQQLRDSLVAKGVLSPPYTNTNEYFEILRKQIEYWDGEKFISIDERKK